MEFDFEKINHESLDNYVHRCAEKARVVANRRDEWYSVRKAALDALETCRRYFIAAEMHDDGEYEAQEIMFECTSMLTVNTVTADIAA